MAVKYFDKNCKEISEEQWRKLKLDRSYCKVGEYADSEFHIFVGWNGRIENAENLFRTSYPLFDSFIMQYDDDSESWKEAPDSGQTFAKESKAREYYEDFLMKYADVELDEEGNLLEVNNILANETSPSAEPEREPQSAEDKPIGTYDEMVW